MNFVGPDQGLPYEVVKFSSEFSHLDQFCRPDGVRLRGRLAKVALQTYKDAQTQEGKDPDLGFAVLLGLIIMFPCYN